MPRGRWQALAGAIGAALVVVLPVSSSGAGATTRVVPDPLYGVTVDTIGNLSQIVAGAQHLPHTPVTRVYFNVHEPASYYAPALRALSPYSYVMGELLDSSDERHIGVSAFDRRVKSYVSTLGSTVDIWEIGNEVNGNWTGSYTKVEAKLTRAYDDVTAAGRRSALTLYDNVGCGDGPRELDPIGFSEKYVPAAVRQGLAYVLLSYYEDDCHGIRPSASAWTAYFARLHALYPNALVGFGEIGMSEPATSATQASAQSLMDYYYGLSIPLPYFIGGYFWWYYDEDCLPAGTKALWSTMQSSFAAEASAFSS